jgi:hypothetical protein
MSVYIQESENKYRQIWPHQMRVSLIIPHKNGYAAPRGSALTGRRVTDPIHYDLVVK